jgi:hypothetical protein
MLSSTSQEKKLSLRIFRHDGLSLIGLILSKGERSSFSMWTTQMALLGRDKTPLCTNLDFTALYVLCIVDVVADFSNLPQSCRPDQ